MKVQSIRFAAREWENIQTTAAEMGVSASQFVRNAANAVALLENAEEANRLRALARGFALESGRKGEANGGQEVPPPA